jgi:DNA polymerase-3 subunit beta
MMNKKTKTSKTAMTMRTIEIEKEHLVSALSTVGGAVGRRHTIPILGNFLLHASDDQLAITATDLEVQIVTTTSATILEGGRFTLPAKKLTDICRALPDKAIIKIQLDDDRAIIRSGRSRFTLSTLPAADYPAMEEHTVKQSLTLEQKELKRLLDKTAFAMAQQDVRYYLNGVLMELSVGQLRTVATNGHLLAMADFKTPLLDEQWQERLQIVIPAKAIGEIKRLLTTTTNPVTLDFGDRTLSVQIGTTQMITKLIDGRYPNYEQVIPRKFEQHTHVDREALRSALLRTSVLSSSDKKFKGVKVGFQEDLLTLQSNNEDQEEANDELEIAFSGVDTTIGFNTIYLLDILSTIESSHTRIEFTDSNSAAVFRDLTSDTELYVLMPMRL